jgi:predicted porin
VNYQATNALLVGLGYSYTRSGGDTSATYHQVSVGADYNLSKRTDVYLTAAYQHASGQTGDGNGGSMAAQASIGSYGYAGTSSQTIVNLGLRHRF